MSMTAAQLASARMYLADPGTSAVQNVLIENALDGTFTISFDGQTTSAIPALSGANVVQNALAALSNIGTGNITVVNDAPYAVYFGGTLGNVAQPMLTVDTTNLIGNMPSGTVSLVTAGGITAFSDDELNGLYSDASNNFFLAIAFGFRVLQANAAKFNDYTAGQTKESKDQIFQHLTEMEQMYILWAFSGQQVQITGLTPVPPRPRAYPSPPNQTATNVSISPNGRSWRRNGWGGWGW